MKEPVAGPEAGKRVVTLQQSFMPAIRLLGWNQGGAKASAEEVPIRDCTVAAGDTAGGGASAVIAAALHAVDAR